MNNKFQSCYSFPDGTEHQIADNYKVADTWIKMQLPFLRDALGWSQPLWHKMQFSASADSNQSWQFSYRNFFTSIRCKQMSLKMSCGSFRSFFWKRHLCVCYSSDKIVELHWFLTPRPSLLPSSTTLNQPLILWSSGNLGFFHVLVNVFAKILGSSLQRCYCSADWHSVWAGRAGQGKKQEARMGQKPLIFEFLFQMSLNQQLWALPSSWRNASSVQWVNKVCAGATASLSVVRSFTLKSASSFSSITEVWMGQRSW